MIFSSVAAHDENAIAVGDIDPVVRHGAASERLSQSRYRGAVSDTGLMFYVDQSQSTQHSLVNPTLLVVQGCAAD
jgi:hypothetical protein